MWNDTAPFPWESDGDLPWEQEMPAALAAGESAGRAESRAEEGDAPECESESTAWRGNLHFEDWPEELAGPEYWLFKKWGG